jgi:quinol monooxygenase YgiN
MSIVVINGLTLLPGKLDEALAVFAALLPDTRAFAGNEGATMHVQQDDPTRLLLVERWATREDFEAYVAWRKSQAAGHTSGLYAAPPDPRVYDVLDV